MGSWHSCPAYLCLESAAVALRDAPDAVPLPGSIYDTVDQLAVRQDSQQLQIASQPGERFKSEHWYVSWTTYSDWRYEQRLVEQNGTLLASYCAEHCVGDRNFGMSGGVAVRRYYQSDRVEFVYSGKSRTMEVQGEPVSGITMRETGIVACSRAAGDDTGHLSSFEMTHMVEIKVDTTIAEHVTHLNAVIAILAHINPIYCDEGMNFIEGSLLRQQMSV